MAPIDQFSDEQFVSDECGDSLWNEENLNPPTAAGQTKKAPAEDAEKPADAAETSNNPGQA